MLFSLVGASFTYELRLELIYFKILTVPSTYVANSLLLLFYLRICPGITQGFYLANYPYVQLADLTIEWNGDLINYWCASTR